MDTFFLRSAEKFALLTKDRLFITDFVIGRRMTCAECVRNVQRARLTYTSNGTTFVVTMSINIANRTAAKRSRSVPIVILRCRDITTPNPICVLRFNAFQSRLFLHLILRFATLNGVKIYVLMYLTAVTFCVYIWQSTLNCVYTFGGCCCCCKVVSLDLLFPFFSIFIHSFLVNLPVLNAFKL